MALTVLDARPAWLVLASSPQSGLSSLYASGNGGATWSKVSTFGTAGSEPALMPSLPTAPGAG